MRQVIASLHVLTPDASRGEREEERAPDPGKGIPAGNVSPTPPRLPFVYLACPVWSVMVCGVVVACYALRCGGALVCGEIHVTVLVTAVQYSLVLTPLLG